MKTITYLEWCLMPEKEANTFSGIIKRQSGIILYLRNGLYHRLDGPARTFNNGRTKEYWIDGIQYRKKEFLQLRDFIQYKNL